MPRAQVFAEHLQCARPKFQITGSSRLLPDLYMSYTLSSAVSYMRPYTISFTMSYIVSARMFFSDGPAARTERWMTSVDWAARIGPSWTVSNG